MALTDKDKRTLTIGGAVVGVLLVGFLLFNLLGGGGGEPTASRAPRPTSTTPSGGTDTGSPTLAPSPVLVLPARDPFSIPPGFAATSSSSGTGSGSGSGSTSTSTTSSGGGSGSTSTSTTAPGGPGNGASRTVGGHTLTLISTFTTNGVATVQVDIDGTVYAPAVGESFGPNKQYRLQSVSGNCATFLYGDESFTLCVPQNK
jgi:hypothetical protein